MESQIASEFTQASASFFKDRSEYDHAHVLLLHWSDGDLEVDGELNALRLLFGKDLNYLVASFPIPGDGTQQARLNKEVASFIEETALQPRSLSIIYYAGHCAESEGNAMWAARSVGGPTLIWSNIQKSLFDAHGDVLLLLDCCHATLISKGRKQYGRLEIIAACAKGLETPIPGSHSFTQALLDAFTFEVIKNGITALELRSRIDGRTRETPFWDSLGGNAAASITIRKLVPTSQPRFMSKPKGYVIMRASLVDDLDGIQLSNWLKTNAPRNVTAVNIEAIVLKARRLQKNVDNNAFPPNSILRKLEPSTQADIIKQLQTLDTRIVASMNQAKALSTGIDKSGPEVFQDIKASVDATTTSIETSVALGLDQESLKYPVKEDTGLPPEILDTLLLRKRILGLNRGHERSYAILSEDLWFPKTPERFRFAKYQHYAILIEFFAYEPDRDGEPFPESLAQLEHMTALLCDSKRPSFRTLSCLGHVRDNVNNQFGLVFHLSTKSSESKRLPQTLKEMYQYQEFVPLGLRIQLAHSIVTALEELHRVGWVHKAINSENICFVPQRRDRDTSRGIGGDEAGDFNLLSPWLFGFEYARAGEAGTKMIEDHAERRNIYRHPDRWSKPTTKFTRAHDIFSLGVVLLEIAVWKPVGQIPPAAEEMKRGKLDSLRFRNALMDYTNLYLPHQVGEVFADTIRACFEFDKTSAGMSEFQMQRCFQESILGKIMRAVGNV